MSRIIIVGAGIYGLSAALELLRRGYAVDVVDPGPLPHPLASSTDISKIIRMEYGGDAFYMSQAARAREGWLRWNDELGETLYHECGLLVLASAPLTTGQFEGDSYALLQEKGFAPQRLNKEIIGQQFPAWNTEHYIDGFFHSKAGYAESGRVVAALAGHLLAKGGQLHLGSPVAEVVRDGSRVAAVRTANQTRIEADAVVVAAGVWSPLLVPELQQAICVVGQPIFHLRSPEPGAFTPPAFPIFTADISESGWYGFPEHPRTGVIKIAHHGVGRQMHPDHPQRSVSDAARQLLRGFLAASLPGLTNAEIVYERLCLYCDSRDGHFFIDAHPEVQGLFVATGGSGHGFKFGPVLGQWIADAVEGKSNPEMTRFAWRRLSESSIAEEAARCWTVGFGS